MVEYSKPIEKDALGMALVNAYTWKTQYENLMPKEVIEFRISNVRDSYKKYKNRIIEDGQYFVAKIDDTVIGFVRYGKSELEEGIGEIHALYLFKSFSGMGIGRKLFTLAKDALNQMGYSKIRVNCLRGNPSLEFYKHMGGVVSGEFENEMYGHKIIEDIIYYK